MEDVFLAQCEAVGTKPVLLRPINLDDAKGEMHPGVPRGHVDLPHASYVITKRPARLGAPLELTVNTPRATYGGLAAVKPAYQAANIACAVTLAEAHLDRTLDSTLLYEAVVKCPTPGRFDLLRTNPPIIIDACHNPQSVETFLTAVRAIDPTAANRPALLCAALADKDCAGMVALLAHEFPYVYVTQTSSARALPAQELAELFREQGADVRGVYPTVDDAVSELVEISYIACGSITLAGEVAGILRP